MELLKPAITSLLLLSLLLPATTWAQEDPFSGTWKIENGQDGSPFSMQLHIADAQNNHFYPAQLSLSYENFRGTYQLLFVKKANGEFAISRNKYAVQELPFKLGSWMVVLNGTARYMPPGSGPATIAIERIPSKKYGMEMPALMSYTEADRSTVMRLTDLLRYAPLKFKKINADPWRSGDARKLVHSQQAPAYMGIIDTFYTNNPAAIIRFSENNRVDNDTISLKFNGTNILNQVNINDLGGTRELKLDTGLNLLMLFADNYGRVPPNTARMDVQLAGKKFSLDFTKTENLSATYMVAKIFYYPERLSTETAIPLSPQEMTAKINQRNTILIDSLSVQAAEITLAIWDDAIDDGDSISLQVNNDIFSAGVAVKKKPRFLTVKLNPGNNQIIFMADNLGSIAPNTAMLEIIDGKRRKAYNINTNLGQNNAIKILYDIPVGR